MANASPLTAALAFLLQSALATDRLQTQHWVKGTPDRPVTTPSGQLVYEVNPLLAGQPEAMHGYFDVLDTAAQQAPSEPAASTMLGTAALAAWAAGQSNLVGRNNDLARKTGLPQYWMLVFRKRF